MSAIKFISGFVILLAEKVFKLHEAHPDMTVSMCRLMKVSLLLILWPVLLSGLICIALALLVMRLNIAWDTLKTKLSQKKRHSIYPDWMARNFKERQ